MYSFVSLSKREFLNEMYIFKFNFFRNKVNRNGSGQNIFLDRK